MDSLPSATFGDFIGVLPREAIIRRADRDFGHVLVVSHGERSDDKHDDSHDPDPPRTREIRLTFGNTLVAAAATQVASTTSRSAGNDSRLLVVTSYGRAHILDVPLWNAESRALTAEVAPLQRAPQYIFGNKLTRENQCLLAKRINK